MIEPYFHFEPSVAPTAFVHERAVVSGRVTLGEHASVWPGAVLRGDINAIVVGDYTNIQDDSVLHVADDLPVVLGRDVVVGHAARIHGCQIGDGCLVGIGAVVLNGAVVGEGSILAAGALVPEGARLAAGLLYMGVPAKPRRALTDEEKVEIRRMARKYSYVAEGHRRNAAALARGERLGEPDLAALEREMHAAMERI